MNKLGALLLCAIPTLALAQKSYEADPQHFRLMFENECVAIIHAQLGPGESNAAPYRSTGAAIVNLTDASFERVTEDGRQTSGTRKAGEGWWTVPASVRTLTNTGESAIEWIAVVPKGKVGCEK